MFRAPHLSFSIRSKSGQSSKQKEKKSGPKAGPQPTNSDDSNAGGPLKGLFFKMRIKSNKSNKGKNKAADDDKVIDVSSYVSDSFRLNPGSSTRKNSSANKRPNSGSTKSVNGGNGEDNDSFDCSKAADLAKEGKPSIFFKKIKKNTKKITDQASEKFSSIKHNLSENIDSLKIGLDNLRARASEHLSLIREKTEKAVSENRHDLKLGLKKLRRRAIYSVGNSYLAAHFKKPSALDKEMKKALNKWKIKKESENKHEKDSDLINLRVATLADRIYKNRVRKHSYIDIEKVRKSMLKGRQYNEHQIEEEYRKIDELFFDEKFQSILKAYMPEKDLKKGNIYISPSMQNDISEATKSAAPFSSSLPIASTFRTAPININNLDEEDEELEMLDIPEVPDSSVHDSDERNEGLPIASEVPPEQTRFYNDMGTV